VTTTNSRFNRRDMVYIAIFGTLWGLAEATLGALLHLLHVPLSGAILASIGMSIILIARRLNDRRGSTLLMALLAASVKMLSFSTVKLGPFVAILLEGMLLELVLSLMGTGSMAFLVSALTTAAYPILQSVATKSILFGKSFVPVILDLVAGFSERIGYQAGWWVLGIYLFLHLLIALAAAGFSWILLKRRDNQTEGFSP